MAGLRSIRKPIIMKGTCVNCQRVRSFDELDVMSYDMSEDHDLPTGTMMRNINYCNDAVLCHEGAESKMNNELGLSPITNDGGMGLDEKIASVSKPPCTNYTYDSDRVDWFNGKVSLCSILNWILILIIAIQMVCLIYAYI